MKIEIDIPDWAKEKNIFIFANQELIAYKICVSDKVKVKVSRCNGCSQCCESGHPFKPEQILSLESNLNFIDGVPCPLLGEEGCLLGNNIPFSCARSDCSHHFDKCSEGFE